MSCTDLRFSNVLDCDVVSLFAAGPGEASGSETLVIADKPGSVRGHKTNFDITFAQIGIQDAATDPLDALVNDNNKMTELEAGHARLN